MPVLTILRTWQQAFVPFLGWIGELKDWKVVQADIVAGVTVALVLVPQSMAYASLAGLPVQYGLYASFLPGMVAALFGSSRQLATGPVAVVSLMTASALEPLAGANPEGYIAYAILLAALVGIFQLALGLLRLGVLVDFLSHPVVIGFTNAAAIIIATSQLGKLFGVSVEKAEHQYETVWNTIVAATQETHLLTLGMALIAFAVMMLIKKLWPKAPAVLIAVVVTTFLSWWRGFEVAGGKVVGVVPEGLPPVSLPTFDLDVIGELTAVAIAISLIGFMEAISIAKAMAAQTRQRLDANQELVGQGLSNITSGLFQGYAVSGSFSRSAVNITAGAITGFSSIVTAIVVGLTLLFLTPLLYHLPQATLAAVIIMAVINLVKVQPVIQAWKAEPHDGLVSVVTFVLTLILAPHLETGIIVGVLLSLGLFVYRTMRPRFATVSRFPDGTLRDVEVHGLKTDKYISIMRFDGSLYFANAGYFESTVLERVATEPDLKFVIIDGQGINQLDSTGLEVLYHLTERLHASAGVELLVARMKKQFMDTLRRSGMMAEFREEHFFARVQDAIDYAFQRLGPELTADSPLAMPPAHRPVFAGVRDRRA